MSLTTTLAARFDRLHALARRSGLLLRLVVGTRILLAVAFIPTGFLKVLGRPFSNLPADHPIGQLFALFHATGGYWQFLGTVQVVAGICLLVPPLRTLGAVLFAPIVVNILALTWTWGFGATAGLVGMMVLANLLLLAWDYDRLKGILFPPATTTAVAAATPLRPWERAIYLSGAIGGLGFFSIARLFTPHVAMWFLLALAALSGASAVIAGLAVCGRTWWQRRGRATASGAAAVG